MYTHTLKQTKKECLNHRQDRDRDRHRDSLDLLDRMDRPENMVIRTKMSLAVKPAKAPTMVPTSNLLQASLTLELDCILVGAVCPVP